MTVPEGTTWGGWFESDLQYQFLVSKFGEGEAGMATPVYDQDPPYWAYGIDYMHITGVKTRNDLIENKAYTTYWQ